MRKASDQQTCSGNMIEINSTSSLLRYENFYCGFVGELRIGDLELACMLPGFGQLYLVGMMPFLQFRYLKPDEWVCV